MSEKFGENFRKISKNIEIWMDFGHFWSKFGPRPLKTHLHMFLDTPGRFAIFLEPKNHFFRRVFRKNRRLRVLYRQSPQDIRSELFDITDWIL